MAPDDVSELDRPPSPLPERDMTPQSASPSPILALSGIGREFGATVAVADLDLELYNGRVHALVGENGAGKSTAAQIAAGVLDPTVGTLEYYGRRIAFGSARHAEASGVVLIPQEL